RSIFAFNDSKQANAPTYQTHGTWTSAPSFASSQTTFTDVDADDNGGGFASWMVGALLVPDVNIGAPLLITGATATTLTVAGDARGVAANGTRYIVYAAPFVNPTHGAWQTDVHKGGTRYLWAGYRYQPPQMGFWVDPPGAAGLGVYGASTGSNRLGQYYCWNRTYDINTGRDTTPDHTHMSEEGWVLEGPVWGGGHDRPVGGVKMRFGKCAPMISVYSEAPDAYAQGIATAVGKRKSWLRVHLNSFPIADTDGDGAEEETGRLGPWRMVRTGHHNPMVGYALAIAVVITYNCSCNLISYDQRKLPGMVDDNYVQGKPDANLQHMALDMKSATRSDRCYSVFADSVGVSRRGGAEFDPRTTALAHQQSLHGTATVVHRLTGVSESATGAWTVYVGFEPDSEQPLNTERGRVHGTVVQHHQASNQ
ncbi:MAG TPA: hypothetical protein PLF37_14145, partial [Planctomycetota bacterium]|nr:hypothetical protein [Planctomycetota bacterium]